MSAVASGPPAAARSSVRPGRVPSWSSLMPATNEHVPQLRWPKSIDTYAAMSTDPQVAALKRAVGLPVRRYRIALDPNGMDPAWAEALADDLDLPLTGANQPPDRSPLRFSTRRLLARALSFLDYGHAGFEIAGELDDAGRWRLADLQPIPHRTISRPVVGRDGRLESIDQWGTAADGTVTITAAHLVWFVWGGEPGNPLGESMLRPLWRPYGVKDRALRLDLMKHERNSMGIPVGWVDEDGYGSDEMDDVLASMAAGEDAFVRLKRGQDFRLRGVEGQASSPLDTVKYCDQEMGRALFAMVLQAGQTGNGTLSSADVHDSYLRMFHDVVIDTFCEQLTQQLCARWVEWNLADQNAAVARIVWEREEEAVQEQTYAYYLEYRLLTIDEARDRIGLPPLPDGEGERFPESFEVRARIEQDGVSAATAELNAARARYGHKPLSEAQVLKASGAMGGNQAPVAASGRRGRVAPADRSRRPVAAAVDVPLPDRELRRLPQAFEAAAGADFAQIDADWQTAYDDVVAELVRGRDDLAAVLLDAIRGMDTIDPLTLADALAPILRAAADDQDTGPLADALERAARDGIDQVVAEADRQGATIDPPSLDYRERAELEATNALRRLGASLVETASTAALTSTEPGAAGAVVADAVEQAVDRLTDAQPEQAAGAATTRAQNAGRGHVFANADYKELYGSAILDRNTCLAPDALVATADGPRRADAIGFGDLLVGPSGRTIRPSAITVSEAQHELVALTVGGRVLRVTPDHRIFAVRDGHLAWVQAGELAVDDLVVSEASLQCVGEASRVDLVLGYPPDREPALRQVPGLASVGSGSERVPVVAIGLDHEIADTEVDDPRADLSLSGEPQALTFEDEADLALDARLGVRCDVASAGAVAAPGRRLARCGAEVRSTAFAGHQDRRPPARLGAVVADLGLAVAERAATPSARGSVRPTGAAALTRAEVVAGRIGHGNVERSAATGAELGDAVRSAAGPSSGVVHVALLRAVDRAAAATPSDLDAAETASRKRIVRRVACPAELRGAGAASGVDAQPTAVDTRSVHPRIVVERVDGIARLPYHGHVYDFTVPREHAFFAEGVLVHNCGPCIDWDGRTFDTMGEALDQYPGGGGNKDCEGGDRCRCVLVGTLVSEQEVAT